MESGCAQLSCYLSFATKRNLWTNDTVAAHRLTAGVRWNFPRGILPALFGNSEEPGQQHRQGQPKHALGSEKSQAGTAKAVTYPLQASGASAKLFAHEHGLILSRDPARRALSQSLTESRKADSRAGLQQSVIKCRP